MTLPDNTNTSLLIEENQSLQIENFKVKILSYLGQLSTDISYFKVNLTSTDSDTRQSKLGLLRIGSDKGGLHRELKLREVLAHNKMVSELITHMVVESAIINYASTNLNIEGQKGEQDEKTERVEYFESDFNNESEIEANSEATLYNKKLLSTDCIKVEDDSEYLEEEYYPETELYANTVTNQLILITEFIENTKTLENWLKTEHSLEENLSISTQVCQFFRYICERDWCIISIEPKLIQIGKPSKFFDLTNAFPIGEMLPSGLLGNYCASELAHNENPVNESMSTYTVGALLYHCINKQPLIPQQIINLEINPIPRIYQVLKIILSLIPEERFSLSQLLSILVETRQIISLPKIKWNIASYSTIGLSTNRLHNEDSYYVKQQQSSNSETTLLAAIADGMGGMSQGEIASQLAIKTVIEELIPKECKTIEKRHQWLISLFNKANKTISENVKNSGTTLSLVLAVGQQLILGHVGDSRIYLLRQGEIFQLSEDHSLVAILLTSGQISEAESQKHPDRNVLTKSLGSKSRLSDGYIQDLRCTKQNLSMKLENMDILLLCSDGVWDLVSKDEFIEIFSQNQSFQSLQLAVDETIELVLRRGAADNATLLALQCSVEKRYI